MSRKPRVELILIGHTKDGKVIRDMELENRFAIHHDNAKVMISYRPYGDLSAKDRLFAYLFGPLLQCLQNAMEDAGIEGSKKDFYEAMKIRYAAYPWRNPLSKKEEVRTLDFSADSTTSAQLGKFVNDIILFLEMEVGVEAPDSQEWKTQQRLGSSKRTFKKDNHGQ